MRIRIWFCPPTPRSTRRTPQLGRRASRSWRARWSGRAARRIHHENPWALAIQVWLVCHGMVSAALAGMLSGWDLVNYPWRGRPQPPDRPGRRAAGREVDMEGRAASGPSGSGWAAPGAGGRTGGAGASLRLSFSLLRHVASVSACAPSRAPGRSLGSVSTRSCFRRPPARGVLRAN
jgi:hypothetical protein